MTLETGRPGPLPQRTRWSTSYLAVGVVQLSMAAVSTIFVLLADLGVSLTCGGLASSTCHRSVVRIDIVLTLLFANIASSIVLICLHRSRSTFRHVVAAFGAAVAIAVTVAGIDLMHVLRVHAH